MDPTLDALDIQGNIIPGFRRIQQFFVAFQSDGGDLLRGGLKTLAGKITRLSETMAHKADRKAAFLAQVAPPTRADLWLNVALGAAALRSLGILSIEQKDGAFKAGMVPARTGDCSKDVLPDGSPNPAHPKHWVVGGPNERVDLLCIFAADMEVKEASAPTVEALEAAGLRKIQTS
jgi:hypothetical protein